MTVQLPGWWTAIRGRMTLQLSGNRHLSSNSRVSVSISGRQLAAGRALPGTNTIAVDLPTTDLGGTHSLSVQISSTLATALGRCAAPDDPTATLQVLPGTTLELEGAVADRVPLSDLPGRLVGALGTGPAPVLLRFDGTPTPDGITGRGHRRGRDQHRAWLPRRPRSSGAAARTGHAVDR